MDYDKAFDDIGNVLSDVFDFPEISAEIERNGLNESSESQNRRTYNTRLDYKLTFYDPKGEFMEQLEDRLALSLYRGHNGRSTSLIETITEELPEYRVVDVWFWRDAHTGEDEPELVLISVYLA